jgi:hypothetical protein
LAYRYFWWLTGTLPVRYFDDFIDFGSEILDSGRCKMTTVLIFSKYDLMYFPQLLAEKYFFTGKYFCRAGTPKIFF